MDTASRKGSKKEQNKKGPTERELAATFKKGNNPRPALAK